MSYSVNSLTTAQDCDDVLVLAGKEKKDLAFRKLSLERKQENYSENSLELSSELTALQAELTTVNTVLETLPEGDYRNDNIKKQKKLEYSIFLLNSRKSSYGAVALLEKEYELTITNQSIAENDAFIAAVTARKAEL